MYTTTSPPRYVSPPGYMPYEYGTAPMHASGGYSSTKWTYTPTATKSSSKSHTRHTSYGPATYTYATPEQATYYSPPAYNSGYYSAQYATPTKNQNFAASTDRMRSKARGNSGAADSSKERASSGLKHTSSKHQSSSKAKRVYVVDEDEGYYSPSNVGTPPPPYQEPSRSYWVDDRYDSKPSHKHTPSSSPQKPSKTSRPRAASYSTPQKPPTQKPARARTSSSAKSPPKATAADAARAGIPAGYSYKNWDPNEEPILLLGSVFDANSLGKWIYDWTVFRNGPATPMSDLAGELWLLLIQLAGKVKRAEECLPRIRRLEYRDLVEDFLESGERLWIRFGRILKICEDYMWMVAKKEAKKKGGSSAAVAMGPKSGTEFVDSIFGRDRKLEETEKLMTGMRLWSVRFDANCEKILRRPSA